MSDFKMVVMQGPWARSTWRRLEEPEIIQEVAEGRFPGLIEELSDEDRRTLDPYSLTRESDVNDPEVPDVDEAIAEWCAEALWELLTSEKHNWAEQGHALTYQWVTGGITTSIGYPERAAEIIESLHLLGLFNETVSIPEMDQAADRRIAREAARKVITRG